MKGPSFSLKPQRFVSRRYRWCPIRILVTLPSLGAALYFLKFFVQLRATEHLDRDGFVTLSISPANLTSLKLVSISSGTSLIKDMSSVDYMACCGLGHRLTKMTDANFLSKYLGLAFRSFWGYCDQTEVFHYLFGPQPADELENVVTSFGQYLRLTNDVKGFRVLRRHGPTESCPCSFEKAREDFKFYTGLRNRFRFKNKVDAFRKKHFAAGKAIIGIHIRAGNGETGDFTGRGRAIPDTEKWLSNLARRLTSRKEWKDSVLFVATDTPSMVAKLESLLKDTMTVVYLDQTRPEEGEGVLFGERAKVLDQDRENCLNGWVSAVYDMMILSYADVVIAARPSSFTQSMPMSLIFGTATPHESSHSTMTTKSNKAFCEVNSDASEMHCFTSLHEWCCNGTTEFSLGGIQGYDYINVPKADITKENYNMQDRDDLRCPPQPKGRRQSCLPYDWSDFRIETNRAVTVLA